MKVALIHYRYTLRGGLETRLMNYMNFFLERGDEVCLICSRISEGVSVPENVRIVLLSPGLVLKPWRQKAFSDKVKKYLGNNQFDFSLSLGRTEGQDAVLAPGNHVGYLRALKKSSFSVSDGQQIEMEKRSFLSSKVIFACSEMIRHELINDYRIDEDKIQVLYPPLNTKKFKILEESTRIALKEKYDIRGDKKTFLFVSSSHERKGLPFLFNLFEQLQNEPIELIIVGYPKVHSALDNVRFLEFSNHPEELYNIVDFTIHPAIYEPFGQIVS
ncbi:MAG: hypothetical protein C0594_04440, partial [Marinilabiliales bacterium]